MAMASESKAIERISRQETMKVRLRESAVNVFETYLEW
jgi:hypothetical protein